MRNVFCLPACLALVLTAVLAVPATAAEDKLCADDVVYQATVGNVTVPTGKDCHIRESTIAGDLIIENGATARVSCWFAGSTTVKGDVFVEEDGFLFVSSCDNNHAVVEPVIFKGDIRAKDGANLRMIGKFFNEPTREPVIVVKGDIRADGAQLSLSWAKVSRDVRVTDNDVGGAHIWKSDIGRDLRFDRNAWAGVSMNTVGGVCQGEMNATLSSTGNTAKRVEGQCNCGYDC